MNVIRKLDTAVNKHHVFVILYTQKRTAQLDQRLSRTHIWY